MLNQTILQIIALLDAKIDAQVNAILHSDSVQELEARWRGIYDLVQHQSPIHKQSQKIKLLCLTEKEFTRDLSTTLDYEQSYLFKKLYNQEYDHAGGKPYGLLILDYALSKKANYDILTVLENMIQIAGACFMPVILQVDPDWFTVSDYQDITKVVAHDRDILTSFSKKMTRLRQLEDARFLFFTCQRYLARNPYIKHYQSNHRFDFEECITSTKHLLWSHIGYLVAAIIMKNYEQSGWFSEIQQISLDLPMIFHPEDKAKVSALSRLEIKLEGSEATALSNQGFLILNENMFTHDIRIDRSKSWYLPNHKDYYQVESAQLISTMLPYLLSVCRFAHYLKIIGREKVGSFIDNTDLQSHLQQWIFQYCGHADRLQAQHFLKYPLKNAQIQIEAHPMMPGHYLCRMDLVPNFKIDQINANLKLVSTIGRGG